SAVQVLDFAKTKQGVLYLVMELLDGVDLGAHLKKIERAGKRLSTERLLMLLAPIVDTLEQAHRIGIIHRDLKPANIFVLENQARGAVRLLDFGLVKDLHADPLTQSGVVAGSPSYIAPECWRGQPDI